MAVAIFHKNNSAQVFASLFPWHSLTLLVPQQPAAAQTLDILKINARKIFVPVWRRLGAGRCKLCWVCVHYPANTPHYQLRRYGYRYYYAVLYCTALYCTVYLDCTAMLVLRRSCSEASLRQRTIECGGEVGQPSPTAIDLDNTIQ